MSTEVYAALLCAAGIAASYIAHRSENIAGSKWFRYAGIALFIFLLSLMWKSLAPQMSKGGPGAVAEFGMGMLFVILAALCWSLFFATFVSGTISSFVRGLVSLDAIRNPPPLSLVDAAIKRRDYAEALQKVQEVIVDYPEEPQPLRKMAEVCLLMDRPDEAVQSYRRAAAVEQDLSQKLVDIFNASDILADKCHRVPAALDEIESFIQMNPEVKGRDFAETRMAKLRAQIR